ncbi:MAG TPA: hypothetical protein VLS27_16730 [Gammaproteobacteria bacterium]|nr:hypothetical protein [Gammaproteobacteria bacterium]
MKEIDGLLRELREGKSPNKEALEILFAPTGPIQEVSVSSGRADEFVALAERFDAAIAKLI